MKIRFVHQYFYPDLSSVSQVISQIAFDLASKGVDVSVLCSRNRYNGTGEEPLPTREHVRGVDIRRCWGPSFGRSSLLGRILDMASYGLFAGIRLILGPRADTVVFLTNPPFFSFLGPILNWLRRERFVYVLMDVYPDVAIRNELLRDGSLTVRFLRSISRFTFKWADRIVVLGDDMRDVAIRSGASPEKVIVIRNWADPEKIYPVSAEDNPLRRQWGLEGKFVVAYSGNFGVSHSFDDLLDVAERLRGYNDLCFLFVGSGVRRREVERYVVSKKLANVILLPYQDVSVLPQSLSAGDVHYVSLRNGFEGLVVPSKAYGIMAAGRPILYQGRPEGEVARMVQREEIGCVIELGNRQRLEREILSLYEDRTAAVRIGMRAREVLEREYAAEKGLALYHKVLTETR